MVEEGGPEVEGVFEEVDAGGRGRFDGGADEGDYEGVVFRGGRLEGSHEGCDDAEDGLFKKVLFVGIIP